MKNKVGGGGGLPGVAGIGRIPASILCSVELEVVVGNFKQRNKHHNSVQTCRLPWRKQL